MPNNLNLWHKQYKNLYGCRDYIPGLRCSRSHCGLVIIMKLAIRVTIALLALLTLSSFAHAAPIRFRTGSFEPPAGKRADAAALDARRPGHYVVQFVGPIEDRWRAAVSDLGIRLRDYIPDHAFIAKLTPEQVKQVSSLDYVRWVGPLAPDHKVDFSLRKSPLQRLDVLIGLFDSAASESVVRRIRGWGGEVTEQDDRAACLKARIPAKAIDALSRLDEVRWVEQWEQPRIFNNVAGQITGAADLRLRSALYGAGQVIAFSDSGLDTGNVSTLSADYSGRLLKAYALRRQNDWSDLVGHGTHAMGCAVGSGQLSGSNPSTHSYSDSFAGIAPEAQFIIQSIGDETAFVYPPMDLVQLFQPAYDDGARIHSNSWGSTSQGKYTFYSQQVDDFVWHHPDMVLVFPSGNDGRDGNGDGITDPGSLAAPGTAKNCITVGATESYRTTGRIITYGGAWPADFPTAPIRDDLISNNPGGMVAWSSRGPCEDGRIKPDICAPGTNIVSPRSQSAGPASRWWAEYDSNYVYWGGTSMSTPIVAGAAALVRQYYQQEWGVTPSAALVKATLLNGALDLAPGQYPPPYAPEISQRPSNAQGWGRLDLSVVDAAAPRVVEFIDDSTGLTTSESRQYQFTVLGSAVGFKATLVWSDPPGSPLAARQLVNDLDLRVVDPQNRTYLGNRTADHTNNVEGVDISDPVAGVYTITVSGYNVPQGPQPFALVVSGELPGSYIAGKIRTASGNPVAGASVSITGPGVSKTTTTNGSGGYSAHVPPGNYTVTPSESGWTFDPPTANVTVGTTGVSDVDFTGSAPAGSITCTITRAVGGPTSYVIESAHPYSNNIDTVYTITGHPDATRIRVHFEELSLEQDMDFILIENADSEVVQTLTGSASDVWSEWVTGNTLKIHMVTDEFVSDYGFYVDGYETDLIEQGGLSGVTVSAAPNGSSAVSGPSGSYAIEGLEPVSYTVKPELDKWIFAPDSRSAAVAPGSGASGIDFYAFPPGAVTGMVRTGTVQEIEHFVESPHPYPPSSTLTYVVNGPPGADRIRVHFSQIRVEAWSDFILINDMNDNTLETYTAYLDDVWSPWVEGDSLKIVLTSDYSFEDDGFYVDKLVAVSNEHGVQGVDISVSVVSDVATTDAFGAFILPELKGGTYIASASKPYWTFEPASVRFSAIPGLTVEGVSFFGSIQTMPSVSYVRQLPDGEEVKLSGQVVTAGTDQLSGCFYIQDANRAAGIKVVTSETVFEGSVVEVTGKLRTVDGERQIDAWTVDILPVSGTAPKPLGMAIKWLGGTQPEGFALGRGPNNVGLLVRVAGKVTDVDADSFYVEDGSIMLAQGGYSPVRALVMCPAGVAPPEDGTMVAVTGISSCVLDEGNYIRVVRARKESDIQSLYAVE